MDGYQYLIQRNRMMIQLEDDLAKLKDLPDPEREQRNQETADPFRLRAGRPLRESGR